MGSPLTWRNNLKSCDSSVKKLKYLSFSNKMTHLASFKAVKPFFVEKRCLKNEYVKTPNMKGILSKKSRL
jgi:hypothetical protein